MGNTKICNKCSEEKQLSEYGKCEGGKYGLRAVCKICSNTIQSERRKNNLEKYATWARRYRDEKKEKYNSYDSKYRKEYKKTIDGYASSLYTGAKSRAFKKGLEFNLTSEWIKDKLREMKCSATGFDLTIVTSIDGRVNPLKPTLDRLDSTKGYTLENTRVTCWWWNVMKQDWSEETVINLIKKYKNE